MKRWSWPVVVATLGTGALVGACADGEGEGEGAGVTSLEVVTLTRDGPSEVWAYTGPCSTDATVTVDFDESPPLVLMEGTVLPDSDCVGSDLLTDERLADVDELRDAHSGELVPITSD